MMFIFTGIGIAVVAVFVWGLLIEPLIFSLFATFTVSTTGFVPGVRWTRKIRCVFGEWWGFFIGRMCGTDQYTTRVSGNGWYYEPLFGLHRCRVERDNEQTGRDG